MAKFEIGVCLPVMQYGEPRQTARWPEIRQVALSAEQMGMDTLWIPDELLWEADDHPAQGAWDGVSMAAAAAAVTSRIKIGSWVLSALHRNPGIIAKTAETLDEISGGRFVFGLGAGHGDEQAHMFGLPEDAVADRFAEALAIILPLMRGERVTFEGKYHAARNLVQAPTGPRPGRIPLLLGAQKPKGMRVAASNGDVWSTYATAAAGGLEQFATRIEEFNRVSEEAGRDPSTIGKAAGLTVWPLDAADPDGKRLAGSAQQIADTLHGFAETGYTQADLMVTPGTVEAFDALAPVVEMLN